LQSRVETYFKTKNLKERKAKDAWENSSVIKSRSREFNSAIVRAREESISAKKRRNREIY
jgi:hypothetical protein